MAAIADVLTFVLAGWGAASVLHARLAQRRREQGLIVTSLHVHPVKGMRGHSVQRAPLDARGLVWDRRWMVVRGEEALFTTQRQVPEMATIQATVLLPPSHAAWAVPPAAVVNDSVAVPTLRLTATTGSLAGQAIDVPAVTATAHGASVLPQLLVWGKPVTGAVDQGDGVAAWLCAALSPPPEGAGGASSSSSSPTEPPPSYRLVFFDPGASSRLLPTGYLPAEAAGASAGGGPARLGSEVGFADGYPLLLASVQSLDHLNARLPPGQGPLPMDRFRPNVVVDADAPWAEDGWRRVAFTPARSGSSSGGAVTMWGVKRCSRCKVTTIDQATGTPHPDVEPLATLRTFRGDRDASGEVYFGMNMVHEIPSATALEAPLPGGQAGRQLACDPGPIVGCLEVGEAVTVLQCEPIPPYPPHAAGRG